MGKAGNLIAARPRGKDDALESGIFLQKAPSHIDTASVSGSGNAVRKKVRKGLSYPIVASGSVAVTDLTSMV